MSGRSGGLRAYPWGWVAAPSGHSPGPNPGNNVATIAAYWIACTEPLLEFEARHRGRCLRVRYEDLVAKPARAAGTVCEFPGLDTRVQAASPLRSPRPLRKALTLNPPDS